MTQTTGNNGGSAWESNPPRTRLREPDNGFEDRSAHPPHEPDVEESGTYADHDPVDSGAFGWRGWQTGGKQGVS